MSRRGRHGRHQQPGQVPRPRPAGPASERPAAPVDAAFAGRPEIARGSGEPIARPDAPAPGAAVERSEPSPVAVAGAGAAQGVPVAPPVVASPPSGEPRSAAGRNEGRSDGRSGVPPDMRAMGPDPRGEERRPVDARPAAAPAGERPAQGSSSTGIAFDLDPSRPSCTVAQLRRFIKSRPWIPLHELRRRFGIYGGDDDVSSIRIGDRVLFIGLPPAEGRLVAELLESGDVGYELSLDPTTPIVVGVYPMRPVPRG